jgi:poly(hydroxyalkanoate) depolymerase family esterase
MPAPTARTLAVRAARRFGVCLVLVAALLVPAGAANAGTGAGSTFSGTYISVWGIHHYRGYVPSTYRTGNPMPLLVALHGCTETGDDFARVSGLTQLAERRGFLVVYPEQSILDNPVRCWNWFLPSNVVRGIGEPAIIAGITDRVREQYSIDPRRIYVTGGSAGGVLSVIMAATYPDIYAAAGVVAGCEYLCDPLRLRSPQTAGDLAYAAMGDRARPVPVILFQGTGDIVVPPITAARIVGQWARTDDRALAGNGHITDTPTHTLPGSVPGGRTFTHTTYETTTGTTLIDEYLIDGAGHAYPGGCGCDPFGDPTGPDASTLQWDFFLRHPNTTSVS